MRNFKDVLAFHEKFDLPRSEVPAPMEYDASRFRIGFMREELDEFDASCISRNLVGAVDALVDFVYVVYGTALFIGTPRNVAVPGVGVLRLRDWPDFEDTASISDAYELRKEGPPAFLTAGMEGATVQALRNRVRMFELFHTAAVEGEPAIRMSLYALRAAATTAYSVASLMNIPWDNCWDRVQYANMQKKRAEPDGSDAGGRDHRWDVVKPAGWKAPDALIKRDLEMAGWKAPEYLKVDYVTGKVYVQGEEA